MTTQIEWLRHMSTYFTGAFSLHTESVVIWFAFFEHVTYARVYDKMLIGQQFLVALPGIYRAEDVSTHYKVKLWVCVFFLEVLKQLDRRDHPTFLLTQQYLLITQFDLPFQIHLLNNFAQQLKSLILIEQQFFITTISRR